jgi:NAD(P)-dependent dehydrogenase (short-subunit alcohol dehydrogenase family)
MTETDEALGTVLVTGAARRIGLAIATHFAAAGRPVVVHASPRTFAEAQAAAARLNGAGARVAALCADFCDAAATERLMRAAAEPFGPITLLVNNASAFDVDAAQDFQIAAFERELAVNLRAPIVLARDFAAQLPAAREGAIVNLIDQRVWRLTPRYFTYTLSKSALWTATQTLAQAFAPRIRVNAVGPGPTLPNAAFEPGDFAKEAENVPLRHAVPVEAIVEAVAFLAGARSVTGQMIAVDSGQHLAWETPDAL